MNQQSTPLVSVIIPVYNVGMYLRRCIDSVLSQTYTNFEVILVDDGSTDDSGVICDEYAAKDSRVVVLHKQNEGVSLARLNAFEHAKGEYITFIDSDDYVDKTYIEHLYNCLISNNADVTCVQVFRVNGNLVKEEIRPEVGQFDKNGIVEILKTDFWYNKKTQMAGMPLFLHGKLIKRKYVKDALVSGKGFRYGEDQLGVLCLLYSISSMYISAKPLYYYVTREGQATKQLDKIRWNEQVTFWRAMLSADVKGYLYSQLPYRVWRMFLLFVNYNMASYDSYVEHIRYALNDEFVYRSLMDSELSFLRLADRVKYNLIKHRFYLLVYIIVKNHARMKNYLNR